jgi:hypothetical protein
MKKCMLILAAVAGLGAFSIAAPTTAEAQYYGGGYGYGYRPYYAPRYYAPRAYYAPRYYAPRYYRPRYYGY